MANDQISRANWKDPTVVKLFLDSCLEEVSNKGKNGGSLKPESWTVIKKILLEKKGIKVNQKQLKNQWDYLKKKYTVWSNLVNNATGHGFDPTTNTMNWSAERWEDYLKGNPDASKFRYVGLQYSEEMKSLFEGITATGRAGWGPSKEGLPEDVPSQIIIDIDSNTPNRTTPQKDASVPNPKRIKKNDPNDLDNKLERVLNNLEQDGPSLKECNEVLDAIEDLDMNNPLYVAALSIFPQSRSYREQWMAIAQLPINVRINWIQMNAKKLGFI